MGPGLRAPESQIGAQATDGRSVHLRIAVQPGAAPRLQLDDTPGLALSRPPLLEPRPHSQQRLRQ